MMGRGWMFESGWYCWGYGILVERFRGMGKREDVKGEMAV
jgi:hypothetical protein